MTACVTDLLVVNGCEMTASPDGWARQLAAELDVPLTNLAVPRASNHRIVRTTVGDLLALAHEANVASNRLLVVVMFTEPDRYEVLPAAQSRRRRHQRREDTWHQLVRTDEPRDEASVAWFEQLQHPASDVISLLLDVTLLGTWLEDVGCRFAFALAHPLRPPAEVDEIAVRYAGRIEPTWLVGGDLTSWSSTALVKTPEPPHDPPRARDHAAFVRQQLLPHLLAT